MNPKNTWMLVLLAGGMFAFIYFFERHIQPAAPVAMKVLGDLKANEVTSIEIDPRGQFTIRVERTNGVWRLTKPLDYPVRPAPIEDLLKALENLTPQTSISAAELQNIKNVNADFGFGTNVTAIRLQQGDEELQLNLGFTTPPGDGIYAEVVGKEGIDIVSPALMALVPTNAGQWRDASFVNLRDLTADQFTNLTVTSTNGKLIFQRDGLDKPWRKTGPSSMFRAGNEKIAGLLSGLQDLRVARFETDEPGANLDQYGLQTPLLELDFKQGTNQFLSLQFGKTSPDDSSLVYARTNSSSTIVLVPRENLAGWSDDTSKFRDPHLFSFSASDKPCIIEAYGPNGRPEFVLRATNGIITVSNADGQVYPSDQATSLPFIRNLAGMRVVPWGPGQFALDAVDDSPSGSDLNPLGLKPPMKSYVIRGLSADGTVQIIAQVDFGLPNTNNPGTVAARRGDLQEHSVFAVKSSDVDLLPTNAIQLRSRRIWAFESTNVTQMTIRINGHSEDWTHIKENDWMPASGITDDGKNIYIEGLVQDLGLLTASYLVGPGDPTSELGFSSNSLQITVSGNDSSGGTAKLSLTFGGAAIGSDGRPNGDVYACARDNAGKNLIFTLPGKYVEGVEKILNSMRSAN